MIIVLCLVWSYVFLDIPSQWLKDEDNLRVFLIKMNVVSRQRLLAWIQQASGVLAQQLGMQTHTYNKSKWYIWQSDWFTADAKHLPGR